MKVASIALIASVLSGSVCAATTSEYGFQMTIRADRGPVQKFKLALPEGESLVVATKSGYSIQFLAPLPNSNEQTTTIRLLAENNGRTVTVHEARQTGVPGHERDVAYVVCKGSAKFVSPASHSSLSCTE